MDRARRLPRQPAAPGGRPRWRAADAFLLAATTAALGAILLGGCGGHGLPPGDAIRGETLSIYTSLPLSRGARPAGQAVLDAERLALAEVEDRIGRYRLRLAVLDDSNPQTGLWDPGQTSQNARLAAADPSTIAYLGDLDSGASAISIPLLNRLGIPQVSPGSSAVGLTRGGPGASPGEPEKYYPARRRTFARVVPSDAVQAAVQLRMQRASGCQSVFVVQDSEVDGQDFAATFQALAPHGYVDGPAVQTWAPGINNLAVIQAVARSQASCVLLSALSQEGTAGLARSILTSPRRPRVFGTVGLADIEAGGGAASSLPPGGEPRVLITAPAPAGGMGAGPARAFAAAYQRAWGVPPSPDSYAGYEAAQLLLGAIRRATDGGRKRARRSGVLDALFDSGSQGVLGDYRIAPSGDTSLTRDGVYGLAGGRLRLEEVLSG